MPRYTKLQKAGSVYAYLSSGGTIISDESITRLLPSGDMGVMTLDEETQNAINDGKFEDLLAKDVLIFSPQNMSLKEFALFCDGYSDIKIAAFQKATASKVTK